MKRAWWQVDNNFWNEIVPVNMHFICEGLNVENTRRGCPRMLAGAPGRGVKGGNVHPWQREGHVPIYKFSVKLKAGPKMRRKLFQVKNELSKVRIKCPKSKKKCSKLKWSIVPSYEICLKLKMCRKMKWKVCEVENELPQGKMKCFQS